MIRHLLCLLGFCTRVELHETDAGIGGRCIDCGKIHGFMSSLELRALAPPAVRRPEPEDACPYCPAGAYQIVRQDECLCHLHPPCGSCVDAPLVCDECGDEVHPAPQGVTT
jgi:hypothetical protein